MISTDILIVGAGPAGSVCANLLKRAGRSCLLIDHATFPRDKICGGGLTPKAWHLLGRLLPELDYPFNPASDVRLLVDDAAACEFVSEEPIRMVERRAFDNLLLQHFIQSGGEFRKEAFLTAEEDGSGRIVAVMKSGLRISCNYLIGADGAGSRVRRYLSGGKEDRSKSELILEHYIPAVGDGKIEVHFLSEGGARGGYYYRFPSIGRDIVGYGGLGESATPALFASQLERHGVKPEGGLRGAFCYLSTDYPLRDNIILIGDAGGFCNRATCEGLYDAFATAQNACRAIVEQRPFSESNRRVFKKMKRQDLFVRLVFTRFGFALLRFACRRPSFIKWCYDTKMKRESFFGATSHKK